MAERYNGWANRDTWLVALWINNDQKNYNFVSSNKKRLLALDKVNFILALKRSLKIGDKVNWGKVNITEIKKMIREDF